MIDKIRIAHFEFVGIKSGPLWLARDPTDSKKTNRT